MASEGIHEEGLSAETMDRHRATMSLREELEAIDWYDQRIEAATDPDLKAILTHNRDEEKEHAVLLLEWLRRRDTELDNQLQTILLAQGSLAELIQEEEGRNAA